VENGAECQPLCDAATACPGRRNRQRQDSNSTRQSGRDAGATDLAACHAALLTLHVAVLAPVDVSTFDCGDLRNEMGLGGHSHEAQNGRKDHNDAYDQMG
jgi:hypothetical protein